jgi:hypothetical protein
VIVHDSPLFPVLTFEGHCGGRRAARLISPQCGAAATPDPRSIGDGAYRRSPSRNTVRRASPDAPGRCDRSSACTSDADA